MSQGAAPIPVRRFEETKCDYLFEMIVRDAQSAAMQIGCVAALLARHFEIEKERSPRALRHFLYDDSRVSRLALRFAPDAGLSPDAQNALTAMYDAVSVAQRELSTLMRPSPAPDAAAAAAVRWRRIAGAARDALRRVHEPTRQRLDAVFGQDSQTLQAFLGEVVAGRVERFDAFNLFTPPTLRQRRQASRLGLRIACQVVGRGGVVDGEIVNLSTTGVGLRCRVALQMGEDIVVRLPDGRQLAAKVLRAEGASVGAQFKTGLSEAQVLAFVGEAAAGR